MYTQSVLLPTRKILSIPGRSPKKNLYAGLTLKVQDETVTYVPCHDVPCRFHSKLVIKVFFHMRIQYIPR